MKNKIILLLLCFALLLGAFSITAFAEETSSISDLKGKNFLIDVSSISLANKVYLSLSGRAILTNKSDSSVQDLEFDALYFGHNKNNTSTVWSNCVSFVVDGSYRLVYFQEYKIRLEITGGSSTDSSCISFLEPYLLTDYGRASSFTFNDVVETSDNFDFYVVFKSGSYTYTRIIVSSVDGVVTITYRTQQMAEHTAYTSSSGWLLTPTITPSSGKFSDYEDSDSAYYYLSKIGEFLLPHAHSYSSSVVSPTHVDKGYTLYTCECGNTYKDNYVNALGHDYTVVTQPSTCTVKGSSTYTCSCGHSYTEELALLPHNYTVDLKASTCTVKGYKVSTCTCGHVLRETLDLLPHSYSVVTKDSTCSVPGSNTYTCSCGHSYSEKLPKLDHTFVGSRCSVCNALDPSLYKDSEDNILNAWSDVYKNFFGLFGSAQSIFYDGSNLTLIGGLAIIGLVLGLGFLLFLVIEKFIHFRW